MAITYRPRSEASGDPAGAQALRRDLNEYPGHDVSDLRYALAVCSEHACAVDSPARLQIKEGRVGPFHKCVKKIPRIPFVQRGLVAIWGEISRRRTLDFKGSRCGSCPVEDVRLGIAFAYSSCRGRRPRDETADGAER